MTDILSFQPFFHLCSFLPFITFNSRIKTNRSHNKPTTHLLFFLCPLSWSYSPSFHSSRNFLVMQEILEEFLFSFLKLLYEVFVKISSLQNWGRARVSVLFVQWLICSTWTLRMPQEPEQVPSGCQNSSRSVSGSMELRAISCFGPYTPCSTLLLAFVHLSEVDMSSLQAATSSENRWAPHHCSHAPLYWICLLFRGWPTRDSWGTNKTLPGRSRTDTKRPLSFRNILVVISLLAVGRNKWG